MTCRVSVDCVVFAERIKSRSVATKREGIDGKVSVSIV